MFHIEIEWLRRLMTAQIHEETGASVGTKGVWYPDRSKATEKDPALYIHISAHTKEVLQAAIDKVNELIAIDMGSLVENKSDRPRERVSRFYAWFILSSYLPKSENGPRRRFPSALILSGTSTLGRRW